MHIYIYIHMYIQCIMRHASCVTRHAPRVMRHAYAGVVVVVVVVVGVAVGAIEWPAALDHPPRGAL